MSDGPKPRQGIVLSGGGANGAYEVGVLKALLTGKAPVTQGEPLVPEIVAGTSVGSFNAAFLVSELAVSGPAAAGKLETVWLDRLAQSRQIGTNGIFRLRGNPVDFLDPARYVPNPLQPFLTAAKDGAYLFWDGLNRAVNVLANSDVSLQQRLTELVNFSSFLSVAPFQETIGEVISFRQIRQTETKLRIPATNWTTGEMTVFTNPEMTDRVGPLAILASSAIPGIFPPVVIGAEPHVDGSVLMNTPLRLVTRNAEILHAVYLDPDIKKIPLGALESTLASTYRQQTIAWAKLVNDDIQDAAAINEVLEVFGRLERGEPIPDAYLEALPAGLAKVWRRLLDARAQNKQPYRQLTIHRYHPRDDLAGGPVGLLNLDRNHIAELIERGFEDAVNHDCDAQSCVLPGKPRASTGPHVLW